MKSLIISISACALLVLPNGAKADTTNTLDPAAAWLGYMNVFELPANGGAYVFGSVWGTADLVATFSGSTLTLAVNHINDPSSYWYTPSGGPGATGNKIMDANMYVEVSDGSLSGQILTFTGNVLNNDMLTNANYSSVAFIKDFAPDYSSFTMTTVPLTSLGVFSVSHATDPSAGRHVQYGFETMGPPVWVTDIGDYGTIQIEPVGGLPAAVAITPGLSGGILSLSFPTQTGFGYTVQYKTNLMDATWETLTVTNGTGSTAVVTDSADRGTSFYRLSIQ